MNRDPELLPVLNSKSLICFIMEIGVFVSFPMIIRQISHEVQEAFAVHTCVYRAYMIWPKGMKLCDVLTLNL